MQVSTAEGTSKTRPPCVTYPLNTVKHSVQVCLWHLGATYRSYRRKKTTKKYWNRCRREIPEISVKMWLIALLSSWRLLYPCFDGDYVLSPWRTEAWLDEDICHRTGSSKPSQLSKVCSTFHGRAAQKLYILKKIFRYVPRLGSFGA